jgi:hypothetical protein
VALDLSQAFQLPLGAVAVIAGRSTSGGRNATAFFLPDEKSEVAGSRRALDIDQAAAGEALPDIDRSSFSCGRWILGPLRVPML